MASAEFGLVGQDRVRFKTGLTIGSLQPTDRIVERVIDMARSVDTFYTSRGKRSQAAKDLWLVSDIMKREKLSEEEKRTAVKEVLGLQERTSRSFLPGLVDSLRYWTRR